MIKGKCNKCKENPENWKVVGFNGGSTLGGSWYECECSECGNVQDMLVN